EFLNRLDETILFRPLSKEDIGGIVDLMIADVNKRLADKEITIRLTDDAKQYVIDHGYDPTYGARPMKRYLQKYVETAAARIIVEGNISEGDVIEIGTDGFGLQAEVKR
ncbi:MAG: type VI secretion system ATPase TssH, partial [Lachnospiraceae bacterium]|nr:type VI secretion system ATPase TssH [Lachnospiraceae bacterium]